MRKIIYLITLLLSISIISASDFNYELIITETLKEDESYGCSINTDGNIKKFKENHEGRHSVDFDRDLRYNLSLNCTRKIDNILLIINKDKTQLEKKTYNNVNQINYNLRYYKLDMKINSDNTTCTLNQNNIVDEYKIDGYLKIKSNFFKTFKLKCDKELDSIEISVQDNDNKEKYYNLYTDILEFDYNVDKTISKDYNTIIYFTDEFEINNKCTLNLDGKQKKVKTFTSDMKGHEKYLESNVGNLINLNCNYPIGDINLFVDNRRWSKEVIHKKFNNIKSFNLNIDKELNVIPVTPKPVVGTKESKEVITNKSEVITVPSKPVELPQAYQDSDVKAIAPLFEEKKSWWKRLWYWIW